MLKSGKQQRTLLLLRHAKSSWKNRALADVDRPLNKRGRRDADAMALRIAAHDGSLETVFASPARRARDTVLRMLLQLPAQETRLVFDNTLYTFDGQTLLEQLKALDDSLREVAIVGHNPALLDAINWLTDTGLDAFPTAACAQLSMPLLHWRDMKPGCAKLEWILMPSTIK